MFIEKIDAYFLGAFTKLSHGFQTDTGRTNYTLAKWAAFATILPCMLVIANMWKPILIKPTEPIEVVIYIIIILFFIRQINRCDTLEYDFIVNGNVHQLDCSMTTKIARTILCIFAIFQMPLTFIIFLVSGPADGVVFLLIPLGVIHVYLIHVTPIKKFSWNQ